MPKTIAASQKPVIFEDKEIKQKESRKWHNRRHALV
jgi:hypothetical protein